MGRTQETGTEAPAMTQDAGASPSSSHAPRERKKPLRTYGKRPAPVKEPEAPSPKRQRIASAKEEEAARKEPPPQLPHLPSKGPPPKRDSILSYFKRIPSSSSIPAIPSSDPIEPTLTPPPSSPAPSFRARKRRRLTTRHNIVERGASAVKFDHDVEEHKDREEEDAQKREPDGGPDVGLSPSSAAYPERKPLSQAESSKLNALESVTATTKIVPGAKKRIGNRPPKDMVQTTLNISLKADSGFTICKECGVLYNPLNEKDRKEHKKQHAAHVRSKAKGKVSASP
ncbi:hypothetical protein QBC34DRAFT_408803 [Podospora aff. communis PSN243]|uniref:N-acetyltransferase ESCO zinc-finger domain-containing protein n=1 Tax=Podospora aff. communis PSN243 TaxID=3040156 RepID=A0AAV9GG22_9PEZI|nr:hypothetical protein QBC34DRAFT_408803 [Podospora aff. communis PSN243]